VEIACRSRIAYAGIQGLSVPFLWPSTFHCCVLCLNMLCTSRVKAAFFRGRLCARSRFWACFGPAAAASVPLPPCIQSFSSAAFKLHGTNCCNEANSVKRVQARLAGACTASVNMLARSMFAHLLFMLSTGWWGRCAQTPEECFPEQQSLCPLSRPLHLQRIPYILLI
jgi:hypothetical protein